MSAKPATQMPSDVGRAAWLFLAPALVLIFVFFFLPVLASLVLSVTDFDIYAIANPPTTRFVGMANYTKLFHSPEFWQALRNTFYFAIVGGPLTIAVSLGTALLLNAKLVRFKSFFRTIYFTPFVTTLVAVSIVWRYLYHTRYGVLNYALAHVGIAPIDWLGNPHWAMPAIILMSVWKNFGYNMLIFIAGLQAIPQDLYDAAEIDGAGPARRFFPALPSSGHLPVRRRHLLTASSDLRRPCVIRGGPLLR
jgi:multiple sugar transport system permease protein